MMSKKVLIRENSTGNVVCIDEINLRAVNYDPDEREWFDIAWENAVEDGLVNDEDRANYSISFVV
jgi:hypothetical protein